MHKVDFGTIDLNLLVALDALLEERSVTRAGAAVGLSQPAMSRALGRLRRLFGDQLLVRTSGGLAPTPRGEALAAPVRRLLAEVGELVRPPEFDPASATGKLRLLTLDYIGLLLLPPLIRRLSILAPGIDVEVRSSPADALALIEADEVDIAIGVFPALPAGLVRQRLMVDSPACMLRAGHPALRDGLDLETYARLPHALVTITGQGPGTVDEALAALGLRRRVALRIPQFLLAPLVVAESDLVVTLPRRLAQRLSEQAPLVVLDPPLALDSYEVLQVWHARRQDDRAHAWLRRQVAAAMQEPSGAAGG